jgi:hypothetical protein
LSLLPGLSGELGLSHAVGSEKLDLKNGAEILEAP